MRGASATMDAARLIPLHEAMMEFKRKVVLDALAHHSGNRSRAAAALQIERTSLLRLLRGLEIAEVVPAPRGRPAGRG
jgi:DNA-binding NtrC family response regulator